MMMSNFRFIERNIDVTRMLKQIDNKDWQAVSTYSKIGGEKNPYGFLPLIMAMVRNAEDSPKDSELQRRTPLYDKYTEVRKYLKKYGITQTSRAAFFRLNPNDSVGRHVDDGKYYSTRDRYHLSLQGTYLYEVDGEEQQIEPGTFFWFDNKKFHSSWNNGSVDRITFVFDVPYSSNNP